MRAQVYRTQARLPHRASGFIGAKSVAQPHKPPAFERDHIETASRHGAHTRQVMLRGAHQPLPLVPADARRGAAVLPPRSCSHFDKHECAIAIAHHEVDLASAAHHIARDEAQSLSLQKRQRPRFERCSDFFGPTTTQKVVGAGWLCSAAGVVREVHQTHARNVALATHAVSAISNAQAAHAARSTRSTHATRACRSLSRRVAQCRPCPVRLRLLFHDSSL